MDLNLLFELEKMENDGFGIKTNFSFPWKWKVLNKIILNREEKIKEFNENINLFDFEETQKAIDLLLGNKDKKIALICDYDVDGITGALVWFSYLTKLGFKVFPIIPERENWYGISEKLVDKAIKNKCEFIVTVDNGTGARKPIKYAKEKGLIVLVTDHHLSDIENISKPDVLLNYNTKTNKYPISWCWVIYTLCKLLWEQVGFKDKEFEKEMLGLVAVSIIADVCPLYGINKKIVENNLNNIRQTKNKAFKSLVEKVCQNWYYPDIWFGLSPMINSMGRYNMANDIFKFFFLKDKKEIESEIKRFVDVNNQRKESVDNLLEKAEREIDEKLPFNLICLNEEENPWIFWIVAWRIANETGKITFVTKDNWKTFSWSGRTWWFPIIETIEKIKELNPWKLKWTKALWHNNACWFYVSKEDVQDFMFLMEQFLSDKVQKEIVRVDTILEDPSDFTLEEIELSEKIIWGSHYEIPKFATKDLIITEIKKIKGKHYKFFAKNHKWKEFEFLYFFWESALKDFNIWEKITIVYKIWTNTYLWSKTTQFLVEKIKKENG